MFTYLGIGLSVLVFIGAIYIVGWWSPEKDGAAFAIGNAPVFYFALLLIAVSSLLGDFAMKRYQFLLVVFPSSPTVESFRLERS
jgi:hypothetical protein